MSTQDIIRKTLYKVPGLSVQFHAHYWGKFEFTEVSESNGHSYFAKATSASLTHRLSFKEDFIYLHQNQDTPLLIADSLEVFLQNATDYAEQRLYDARSSYKDLYTPSQMYITNFSDPEDFEEIEAYLTLIRGIDKHFNNLLGIQTIQGKEVGDIKQIELHLKEAKYKITLHKELFDIELLNALNDIIGEQLESPESLHLSIDSKMRMIILKLDKPSLEAATRMGLII